MENDYKDSRPRTYRDLDAKARERELKSLQELILKPDPITPHTLSEWVSGSDNRTALLQATVWGGIRWPKALGRPQPPSITGGFTITHEFNKQTSVDLGGGVIRTTDNWVAAPAPSVWDATASQSHHRVAFFFYARVGFGPLNRFDVRLASVAWERGLLGGLGSIRLDPFLGYSSFTNVGQRQVFPDYEVLLQPYRIERYIQPLGPIKTPEHVEH
jgi:hypothetical protein